MDRSDDTTVRIDLSSRRLSAEQMAELVETVRRDPRHVVTDLRGCGLASVQVATLAEAVRDSPGLRSLDVSGNGLTTRDGQLAATVLGERSGELVLGLLDRRSMYAEASSVLRGSVGADELFADDPRAPVIEALLGAYSAAESDMKLPAYLFRVELVQTIIRRYRLREYLLESALPEHSRVVRPLFITGLFRTGTTYLHNLLSALDGMRAPRLWELWCDPASAPNPLVGPADPRVERAKARVKNVYSTFPALKDIHPLDPEGPEECALIMHDDFFSFDRVLSGELPNYSAALSNHDVSSVYEYHRLRLRHLGSVSPPRRHWILKTPWHLWFLPELWEVYPDANVVFLHRDLKETVASSLSLLTAPPTRRWYSYDAAVHAPAIVRRLAQGWDRALSARATQDPSHVLDVDYGDLLDNPVGVACEVLSYFGYDREPDDITRLTEVARAADHHRSTHRYSLDDYRITGAVIDREFAGYREVMNRSNSDRRVGCGPP